MKQDPDFKAFMSDVLRAIDRLDTVEDLPDLVDPQAVAVETYARKRAITVVKDLFAPFIYADAEERKANTAKKYGVE